MTATYPVGGSRVGFGAVALGFPTDAPRGSAGSFTIYETFIVLLHGFIKKSRKTPPSDLRLAKERMKSFLKGEK